MKGSNEIGEEIKHKSVNLSWLKYPDNFKELEDEYNAEPDFGVDFIDDNKAVDVKNIGGFIKDIFSGKINNIQDAENEYINKIKEHEDYFNSINSRSNLLLKYFSHQKKE